ncbi:glycoside hydrolase family 2 TIM barrel-domain containing protein [Isosphaeraceae bacterium EP7]
MNTLQAILRRQPRAGGLALVLLAFGLMAGAAEIPRPEHPRPDAVRPHWANLNGPWQFRFDAEDKGKQAGLQKPGAQGFDRSIVVPFCWESELSGIHQPKGTSKIGWYRRSFDVPATFPKDQRVWIHFDAVDYRADVWVNGVHVAEHEGGYSPFSAEITDALATGGGNVLVVRAFDPTDPSLPTGKQVGWYTPTSGIWQTVWLEARPRAFVERWAVRTEIDPPSATFTVDLGGIDDKVLNAGGYKLSLRPADPSLPPVEAAVVNTSKEGVGRKAGFERVTLKLDMPDGKLWSPESPNLYEATLELSGLGAPADRVQTYFGLRTIARGKVGDELFERILLNGKPVYLRGALDQSFNPKGVYTAPSDAFLKGDIELAKRLGLNMLRIHIKPDEPRRLYWADRLGMLIMEDMPNTWQQNEEARSAWEHGMRETMLRDRNHPGIISWVAFNETWGLGRPERYKEDRSTQRWVKDMVAAIRTIDPTRLVEDNSPCNEDHVGETTDLNSWHFYIDDHAEAAAHLTRVVDGSKPGSPFNHCPGERMNSAPLINSEYGGVSAGSGDRDVSWSFRDLTTLMRKQNAIQGYVYTELSDIEWEHNGFVDYDRSLKEFGYSAFVPGMTPADLNGADFIGYGTPPAIESRPGQVISVPLFVSHYSTVEEAATLTWWVAGTDDRGDKIETEPRKVPVAWTPYGVVDLKPVKFKVSSPLVGALALVLEDARGKRLAANFVNVVIRPETRRPRIERISDREVAIRFSPADFAESTWSSPGLPSEGKATGLGVGSFAYRLKLPASVREAGPVAFELMVEASSHAGREQVDWPERINPQDNPQTDARKWPSTVEVSLNGGLVAQVDLPDDPADARGVLSHLARVSHGSYGVLVEVASEIPDPARSEIAKAHPLVLRLRVPASPRGTGGLALYGADTGAYPFDPTFLIRTARDLPADLGADPDVAIAVDTLASKKQTLIPAGETSAKAEWSYITEAPPEGWNKAEFDDQSWARGLAGFGSTGTPGLRIRTPWTGPTLWLRRTVDVPEIAPNDLLTLRLFHDEDVDLWVNGSPLFSEPGYVTAYRDVILDARQRALFRPGRNTFAVRCRQKEGGQGVDVGLSLFRTR